MAKRPRNLPASVRQRLMDAARNRGEDFQYVLTQYGLERLLYRLSQSAHAKDFVLKGAQLFQLWSEKTHRATRDLDLLGRGEPSLERLQEIFREICSAQVEEDGLSFLSESVRAERIREEDEYQGLRIRLQARLGNARLSLQIDIGFGDAVTPAPIAITYPALLEFPAPTIQAYPRETVVAEKLQAIVALGMANSRMKDFYDLWTLARRFDFEGPLLCRAIEATFGRRKTPLPAATPTGLTDEFSGDPAKATQWSAFLRKGKLESQSVTLVEVTELLQAFLLPPVEALRAGDPFEVRWAAGGGWSSPSAQ